VPGIVGIEHAEYVTDPGSNQVGPRHGDAGDRGAAEFVPHEVGRLTERGQLPGEPPRVGGQGAVEAVGNRRSEARGRQEDYVGPVQFGEQRLPDRGGFRARIPRA
jgi:hypothetical protein